MITLNRSHYLIRFLFPILIMTFVLPIMTGCQKRTIIVNALDEKEANEILVFLASKGIRATKVKSAEAGGGAAKLVLWDISVRSEDVTQSMALLNQSGLPRRRGQKLLEIFSSGGALVPSELQEKVRYQTGLGEQIANVIRKIDGILDAEVTFSFPEEDPLNPGKSKGDITASVYVKHSGVLDDPNSHLITKIKRLVQSSVTGLQYDNVTLIDERARYVDPSGIISSFRPKEKEFVRIWSLVIAKESVTRFRMIFFSFSFLVLILLISFIWIGWKVYPVFHKHGGLRALFHLAPIVEMEEAQKEEEKEAEEEKAEEKKEKKEPEEEEPTGMDVT